MRFDNEALGKAIQYLNSLDFHKRLRNDFCTIPNRLYSMSFSRSTVDIHSFDSETNIKKRVDNDSCPKTKVF